MARTASTMLALGTTAPEFSLPDIVSGKTITRDQAMGPKGLLVMFLCAHCPFVQHVNHELARLGRDYAGRGIGIVAISSNDAVTYQKIHPQDYVTRPRSKVFHFRISSMILRMLREPMRPPALRISSCSTRPKNLSIEASWTAAAPAMTSSWMAAICAPPWTRCWPVRR